MYYRISNDNIEEINMDLWMISDKGIAVFTEEQWSAESVVKNYYSLFQSHTNIRFCKLESHEDYLFGTIHIPREKEKEGKNLVFYVLQRRLVLVDNTGLVKNYMMNLSSIKVKREYSLERFFYDFLVSIISEDLICLESLERELTKLEEEIILWKIDNFNQRLLKIKKQISHLHRYYSQLTDLGTGLYENEMDFFDVDNLATFKIFAERAGRLQEETKVLREYAMQVQEVYQSETGIRQNDVMKVLTVVTTIFLPLTLIVGWYGMNFSNMPELSWKYGYPWVVMLSITVVLVSIWVFKRKKLW